MLTSFIGVFEDKLKMHKNEIKEELQKAKTDRRKAWMKATIKEAKELNINIKFHTSMFINLEEEEEEFTAPDRKKRLIYKEDTN